MTPDEVERRAHDRVHGDIAGLARSYRERFGNEVSTDNAREIVSPEYAESPEARTRYSEATQKPAGLLSDFLFDQALQHPDADRPRRVVMTAGGTGAGKTTVLGENLEMGMGQFVYDSNLGSKKSSVAKIDAARAAGNQVRIVLVQRDPIEALTGGVLPRAMDNGRVVTLDAHARMYRDSAENFAYLVRKYAHDPGVHFVAVDNTGGAGASRVIPVETAAKVRYSTRELLPKLPRRWRTNMPKAESAKKYIEQLSALPPRKRLEAFRAIEDPEVRRLVDEGLPGHLHAEMLGESAVESLNRNALAEQARRQGKKPGKAA